MVAQVKAQHSQSPKQQFLKQVKLNVQEDLNTLFTTLTEEKSTVEDVVEQNNIESIVEGVTVPEIKPAAV